MHKLSNPAYVSSLLQKHKLKLKKKWGQNFLADENILNKIVAAAAVTQEDNILEIGPGIGALTQKLAKNAGHVTALEIDSQLVPVLHEVLAEYDNVAIILCDALKADYAQFCIEGPVKLVANLPYNVATPLFYRWLKDLRACFSLLVCMVQKEVAQRIIAAPGGKDYGTLSVISQYAAHAEIAFDVPNTVFIPRPDVASAVVRLKPFDKTPLAGNEEQFFYRVVEAVFAQRRKTSLNTLHAAFGLNKAQLNTIGSEASLDLMRRGETLTVEELVRLTRLLYPIIGGH